MRKFISLADKMVKSLLDCRIVLAAQCPKLLTELYVCEIYLCFLLTLLPLISRKHAYVILTPLNPTFIS